MDKRTARIRRARRRRRGWCELTIAGTAEASNERLLAEVLAAIHLSNAQRLDEASAQLVALGETAGVVGVFARLVAGQLAGIFGRYDEAVAALAGATGDRAVASRA